VEAEAKDGSQEKPRLKADEDAGTGDSAEVHFDVQGHGLVVLKPNFTTAS
jgi:hypothetical protein